MGEVMGPNEDLSGGDRFLEGRKPTRIPWQGLGTVIWRSIGLWVSFARIWHPFQDLFRRRKIDRISHLAEIPCRLLDVGKGAFSTIRPSAVNA